MRLPPPHPPPKEVFSREMKRRLEKKLGALLYPINKYWQAFPAKETEET
jgi:hypothetical protein